MAPKNNIVVEQPDILPNTEKSHKRLIQMNFIDWRKYNKLHVISNVKQLIIFFKDTALFN
jgi:hypothetical protein